MPGEAGGDAIRESVGSMGLSLEGASAVLSLVGAKPSDGYRPPASCHAAAFWRVGLRAFAELRPLACTAFGNSAV